jgi:hypothetical protein
MLAKVNVPGRVTHFEANTGRVLTIEDRYDAVDANQDDCYELSNAEPNVQWTYTNNQNDDWRVGFCNRISKSVHLLKLEGNQAELVRSVALDGDDWFLNTTAITNDRVFVRQYRTRQVTQTYGDQTYTYWAWDTSRVRVLDASLEKLTDFETDSQESWSELRARGKRAFTSENGTLRIFDTSDADAPKSYDRSLLGYGCDSLEVRGNTAVCSQGKKGVEVFTLE